MISKGEEYLKRAREEVKSVSAKLRSAELAAFNLSASGESQTNDTSTCSRMKDASASAARGRTLLSGVTSTARNRKRSLPDDSFLPISKRAPSYLYQTTDETMKSDSISHLAKQESEATARTEHSVATDDGTKTHSDQSEIEFVNSYQTQVESLSDSSMEGDHQYAVL